MDWANLGFDVNDQLRKDKARREEEMKTRRSAPRRFWLARGASTSVILLDDTPFCIYEWNLMLNGKFGNYFTDDSAQTGENIFEEYKNKIKMTRSYLGFLSVIDCTEYMTRGTNENPPHLVRNSKKLLPCPSDMLVKIKAWKEKKGSLVGCQYTVTRSDGPKAPRIGDDWQFEGRVDLSTILDAEGNPVDTTPAAYREILKPRSHSDIRDYLSRFGGPVAKPVSAPSLDNSETSDDSDQIPY
jgi:hypothetical protein